MRMKYSRDREEVDSGCKYAENCFECPFPDCVLNMKDVRELERDSTDDREAIVERAKYVKKMRDSGKKLRQIAIEMDCSVKAVRRDIIIAKEEERKSAEQTGHQEG